MAEEAHAQVIDKVPPLFEFGLHPFEIAFLLFCYDSNEYSMFEIFDVSCHAFTFT